jgi:hypothetical protein
MPQAIQMKQLDELAEQNALAIDIFEILAERKNDMNKISVSSIRDEIEKRYLRKIDDQDWNNTWSKIERANAGVYNREGQIFVPHYNMVLVAKRVLGDETVKLQEKKNKERLDLIRQRNLQNNPQPDGNLNRHISESNSIGGAEMVAKRLQQMPYESETFKVILEWLAHRERKITKSNLHSLYYQFKESGQDLDKIEFYKCFERLHQIGAGTYIRGRTEDGKRMMDRFEYGINCIDMARIALGESVPNVKFRVMRSDDRHSDRDDLEVSHQEALMETEPRKRGRPKGSTSKKGTFTAVHEAAINGAPKRRGRPKGSTNNSTPRMQSVAPVRTATTTRPGLKPVTVQVPQNASEQALMDLAVYAMMLPTR